MQTERATVPATREAAAGAAVYSKLVLAFYDLEVLGFELPFIFKCPTPRILELYDRHVSACHLDVGVGTGYFLDRCRFPVPDPEIHLMDLNPNCLERTSRRIHRYRPVAHLWNVLEPIEEAMPRFGSISATNLLHCLPGTMLDKERFFRNVKAFLREGGVIFGATVLGQGVEKTGAPYRAVNRLFNKKSIFCNEKDNAADLDAILARNFDQRSVKIVGSMALFTARR
jgi:SAM-dependent methyltransferase